MDAFHALADPSRRALLNMLLDGERPAGDLAAALPGLCQPAVSRHLQLLRKAGLVEVRAEGQRRIYRLQPFCLAGVDAWLRPYRRFGENQIASLGQRLAEWESRSGPKTKKKGRPKRSKIKP